MPLVVETHLPYVAKVLVLTLTATVLVIWVAEPSAARILRGWLHAPALRHRRKLGAAPALWRARTVLRDEPGSLQGITGHPGPERHQHPGHPRAPGPWRRAGRVCVVGSRQHG